MPAPVARLRPAALGRALCSTGPAGAPGSGRRAPAPAPCPARPRSLQQAAPGGGSWHTWGSLPAPGGGAGIPGAACPPPAGVLRRPGPPGEGRGGAGHLALGAPAAAAPVPCRAGGPPRTAGRRPRPANLLRAPAPPVPVKVPPNAPLTGREEISAAAAVLRSGSLTSASHEGGGQVRMFESEAASYTGARLAVAVNSGTAALQAALLALGIGRGDEVLVPSFTFAATANAVVSVGARPVFVDILGGSYTMDPAEVEERMTPRTKAVVPVHLYGGVARMEEIAEAAKRRGAHVIEDAAQALGSTLDGRHAGTFGAVGCFSLYPAKVITSGGEGGFAVTDRPRLRDRMRMARNHGMLRGGDVRMPGLNLRMPEMAAAIGRAQLAKLPRFLRARRRNAGALSELLAGMDVRLPSPRSGEDVNWYLYTVSAGGRRRDALARKLNAAGIGAAAYYSVPVHRMPLYDTASRRPARPLTETLRAAREVLSLPVHPGVTADDLRKTARIVGSVVGRRR